MKKGILLFLAAAILLTGTLAGCEKRGEQVTTGQIGVVRDEEFGNVYLDLTIEEFNALGFTFGDSIDLSFDNGKHFEDVPYYSGYYVPIGHLLACGYPGYPHVSIARNYGASTWEEFGMTASSKVTVTLRERGKYLGVQELYALEYSDDRNDYDSDVIFANFRAIRGGDLKQDFFYRSASPCDDQHQRAACADRLAGEAGTRFVLNLADSDAKYQGYKAAPEFSSDYYDSLVQQGNVLLLAMNANYRADAFAQTISQAFYDMTEHEGPCLIHCLEGKDRTGFVCALLLALADASAQEIIDDYMTTYTNYYKLTKQSDPKKYEAVLGNVQGFLECLCDAPEGTPLDSLDLQSGARSYLRRGGLSDDQIARIEEYITK